MIRALRATGSVLLWVAAVVGLLCGLVWVATQVGMIKPLVVVSGSMEPGIMTGDLVVDRPAPTSDATVGQVASIRSAVTGKIITHRIVSIEQSGADSWDVRLKGDANDGPDAETYGVGATMWHPVLRVPGGGDVISTLTRPSFTVPVGIALLACIALTLFPSEDDAERSPDDDGDEPDGADADDGAGNVAVGDPEGVTPVTDAGPRSVIEPGDMVRDDPRTEARATAGAL